MYFGILSDLYSWDDVDRVLLTGETRERDKHGVYVYLSHKNGGGGVRPRPGEVGVGGG